MSIDAPAFSHPDEQTLPGMPTSPAVDAPHGYKPDGTPYQRSQEWRKKGPDKMSAPRKAQGGPPPRKKSTPQAKKVITYADTVGGILQMIAGGMMIAGRMMPVMRAHAIAVTMHAEPIGKAVESVALEDSRVAAILDRVATVGPYGALVMAIVPLGMQMMANHGLIPPNPDLGIYDPHDLLKEAGIDAGNSEDLPHTPTVPAE
jgi:hypothetical protein